MPTNQSDGNMWVMVELRYGELGTGNVIARSWISVAVSFVPTPSDEG
jgi:hypothetical protein